MVPDEFCGRPYLLKGGPLRFRRDGTRVRVESGAEVTFQPQDVGVDVGLLIRQRQIVEAPKRRSQRTEPTAEEGS